VQGPQGLQGPAGPGADGWVNRTTGAIAIGSAAEVTVATLNLSAGSYLILGKASIVRTGGNGTNTCRLYDGAAVFDLLQNQNTTSGELSVLHAPLTLAANAAVTMRCQTSSGTSDASNRTLSAYKLNSLTTQ
jgi:hypothetical protein